MYKKSSKVFSSVLAGSLILGTMFPVAAFANTTQIERLAGNDRYETAVKVAEQGWNAGAKTVILAPGMDANLVDALTAAPLAKAMNAPILLTEGDKLTAVTKEALKDLGVEKVIVVSGVIDDKKVIEETLENEMKLEVLDLGGNDRFVTAANIANEIKDDIKGVMVTTAYTYADALSVSSIAAAKGMAIILADGDVLPTVEADLLDNIKDNVNESYVLGGEALVGPKVFDVLPGNPQRIAGKDRYETNLKVLKQFADLKFDQVYVANGENDHLIDALVASSLAAKTDSPIVLASQTLSDETKNYVLSKTSGSNLVALGGQSVVANTNLVMNHVRAQDFAVMQLSGVNGYNVGFSLVDGKDSSDLEQVVVSLYKGDKLLASNVSTYKLLSLGVKELSSPFNIDGSFDVNDPYWYYSPFDGTVLDVPTKAVITATYQDGSVYTVTNSNLAGDPEQLKAEALKHVKPQDFGVMQLSGVNGYSVGFELLDGKKASDLALVKVLLFKDDTLLAENTSKTQLFVSSATKDATQLSAPFNIDGTFEGTDGFWSYGKWAGEVTDVPNRAVIIVAFQNGKVYTVENTNLTGDPASLVPVVDEEQTQEQSPEQTQE